MSAQPYTIRIFVAQGDPDGVRFIDRMNWTGLGIVIPREQWAEVRSRREFERAGIYMLIGPDDSADVDESLQKPRVYVGEGDGVRDRIDSHVQNKAFWHTAIVFVSNTSGLNKAHVQWLEHELLKRAKSAQRCVLDNGNMPQTPALAEHEVADVRGFLDEVLRILPLVEVRVFEPPRHIVAVAQPANSHGAGKPAPSPEPSAGGDDKSGAIDTVVVPANEEGFRETFLGENAWYAIRISGAMLNRLKYIAAYRTKPISAVTHFARVKHIEPYGDGAKYKVVFAGPAEEIPSIPFGDATSGAMQGPRYTTYAKLRSAKKVSELLAPVAGNASTES